MRSNAKKKQSKKKLVSSVEKFENLSLLRLQPPTWEPAGVLHGSARYVANSSVGLQVLSIYDLLTIPFIMAVTAVLGFPFAVAARIKRIRLWGFVATAGTAVGVTLVKGGIDAMGNDFNDPFRRISDSSNSYDRPAFVEMKFDKFTPSGSFHTNEAVDGNLIYISAPAGAIMDIEYAYVINSTFGAATHSYVLVGATPGTVARRPIVTTLFSPLNTNSV